MTNLHPDIILAKDLEAFFKQNWQQLEFDDMKAISFTYLVILRVIGLNRNQSKGQPHGDKVLSLLGPGTHSSAFLNSGAQDSNDLSVQR